MKRSGRRWLLGFTGRRWILGCFKISNLGALSNFIYYPPGFCKYNKNENLNFEKLTLKAYEI